MFLSNCTFNNKQSIINIVLKKKIQLDIQKQHFNISNNS